MNLTQAKKFVFKHKPVLGKLYKEYGKKSWLEYGKIAYKNRPLAKTKKTKELIEVFEKLLVPLAGREKARQAADTLRKTGMVSTADHHGILCHPFFVNNALLQSHPLFKKHAIIALTCGGISLNNSSFPRGIFFHDSELKRIRMPFVTLQDRHMTLYGYPSIPRSAMAKQCLKIDSFNIGKAEKDRLKRIFHSFLSHKKLWKHSFFSEQLTVINNMLWTALFGNTRGSLIYLESESLVRQLLLDVHLHHKTVFHKILFDHVVLAKYLKAFDGITGAHKGTVKGSHLFWYIDRKYGKRIPLWYNKRSGKLNSEDNTVSVSLDPATVRKSLINHDLLPTTALCYSMLAFYYGLTLGGGFSQIQYLGEMKKAYMKISGTAEKVKTDLFTGEFVAVGLANKDTSVPATLFDILIWGGDSPGGAVNQQIERVKIGDSLDAMVPEFLKIIDKSKTVNNTGMAPETFYVKSEYRGNKTCPYCGNNPVNHVLYKIEARMENVWDSLSFITERMNGKFADRIVDIVLKPVVWSTGKAGFWTYHRDLNKSQSDRSKVIWEEARKRNIPVEGVVAFGKPIEQYRAYVNGRWHHFQSIPVPPHLDTSVYKWIDDKGKLRQFLRDKKLPVAYGGHTKSLKEALDIFRKGESPFIAKPRSGSRGRHTTTHIYTEKQLINAFGIAQQLSSDVVIEEHLVGSVYRGTYIGGKVVGILRGDTPRVTGDGIHTVRQLIAIKNKTKHHKVKDFVITDYTIDFLQRQKITLDTVLKKGRTIDLSEKIGISYGGFAAEDLPITHPKILKYIKKAGDALNGPVIGFDFIIPEISKDPDKQRWGIIEANSLPFIDLHHFPLEGPSINAAAAVWDLWENTV